MFEARFDSFLRTGDQNRLLSCLRSGQPSCEVQITFVRLHPPAWQFLTLSWQPRQYPCNFCIESFAKGLHGEFKDGTGCFLPRMDTPAPAPKFPYLSSNHSTGLTSWFVSILTVAEKQGIHWIGLSQVPI